MYLFIIGSVSVLGGGGQRKLVVIPPDSDGYSGQQLKAVSGNGKCILYIAPLQEELDRTPLPLDAKVCPRRSAHHVAEWLFFEPFRNISRDAERSKWIYVFLLTM